MPGIKPHLPLRDAEGADRFQAFLVSAVASIAVTRTFLVLTGYPQLGGGSVDGGLHLAHLLWGGLGMVIAKHCTQLHGGRISFQSREDHGAIFTVELPLFSAETARG